MFGKLGKLSKARPVSANTSILLAPLAGSVIALSDVKNPTFAKGLLGQGAAIIPSGGRVVAPSDSRVEAIFPTGYAVALHTKEGLDLLIHVGLDTIKLEGRHFKVHASEGDEVSQGQVLIEFDREAIAAEGFDVTVPILLCNSVEFSSIKWRIGARVDELDRLCVARKR